MNPSTPEERKMQDQCEEIPPGEYALVDRLLGLAEEAGASGESLAEIVHCIETLQDSGAPIGTIRQQIIEAMGEERTRLGQLWMLFQFAESLFDDPERLRQILYLEQWALRLGVSAELHRLQASYLRVLSMLESET